MEERRGEDKSEKSEGKKMFREIEETIFFFPKENKNQDPHWRHGMSSGALASRGGGKHPFDATQHQTKHQMKTLSITTISTFPSWRGQRVSPTHRWDQWWKRSMWENLLSRKEQTGREGCYKPSPPLRCSASGYLTRGVLAVRRSTASLLSEYRSRWVEVESSILWEGGL